MKPHVHARISAKRFGGSPGDYVDIHEWFDHTKAHVADMRHRMLLHNSWGIYLCAQVFGDTRTNSAGEVYSVRDIGEQHVIDDLGHIPTLDKCLSSMPLVRWMGGPLRRRKKGADDNTDPYDIIGHPGRHITQANPLMED